MFLVRDDLGDIQLREVFGMENDLGSPSLTS